MPRFYLHVHDTLDAIDDEGIDLPHLNDACAEAISGLRCVIAGQVRDGRLVAHTHVSITDEAGERLAVVNLSDAVEISMRLE
jgi:hypothetical protein